MKKYISLFAVLAIAASFQCNAQTSAVTNVKGREYPKVNPDNSVTVKVSAPDAESVSLDLGRQYPMTGTNIDYILKGINQYLLELVKEQIRIAFEQSQKEVDDLHQRTAEGIMTARLNGKQIGNKLGSHRDTNNRIKLI